MLYWPVTYWYSSTCTWSHLCDAFRASILFELGNFIMLERWYTTLLTNFIGTTFYSKCMLCRVFGGNWSPFSIHWRLRRCIIETNATKWTRQHARIVFHQKLSSMKGCLPLKVVFHRRLSSTKSHLPLKVVFHWRLSSIEGRLPQKVVFHRRLSSTEGCLPPKVVFHRRLSSTEGHLLMKVVFHQRSSSTECRLPQDVVFHRRSSSTEGRLPEKVISTKGRLPPKVVFHRKLSSIYHNTFVHLIFVWAVNISNLSFLPAMHDAWCMMLDAWCTMHDAWCMMHDAWCRCMSHDDITIPLVEMNQAIISSVIQTKKNRYALTHTQSEP